MKIKSFEFNLRELSGAMGDMGTLLPLAVGYFAVCGLDPAGLLVMMGLANIATGLVYRLPMPIEPMKVLAVVAIAQQWSPSMVYASGFAMGIVWLFFAITGVMYWVAKFTPHAVIRGIQVSLGVLLAVEALKMLSSWWLLGLISLAVVLLLRKTAIPRSHCFSAPGLAIMVYRGTCRVKSIDNKISGDNPFHFPAGLAGDAAGGVCQIPLTATNAVISTSSLISTYWLTGM